MLACCLDDLLRHGQREGAPLAVALELEAGEGGGRVVDLDLVVESGLQLGDGGVGDGGAVHLGDEEVVDDRDHAGLSVLPMEREPPLPCDGGVDASDGRSGVAEGGGGGAR